MAQIIHTVTRCDPIEGTDRTHVDFAGETGTYQFELTSAALDALVRGVLSEAPAPGQASSLTNAIMPTGCAPFESRQGLCGIAFDLGGRQMFVAIPPGGITDMRRALDTIEAAYNAQKKTGP
jgi:hypothetical protein